MSFIPKRDRKWEVATVRDDSANSTAASDPKRRCISSPLLSASSPATLSAPHPILTPVEALEPLHPMALLDAIRTKLHSTSDPHLQAHLLLQYSSTAVSPDATTAAAIDFLFLFLQQHQTQTETLTDRNQMSKDAGSSGAIVVGAIVRGLRQLLAVKAAVVEPMIQVDAMGEQLMQCMSVSEDFKLRRDMMHIVVDCLMLKSKYEQVEKLLHTCLQDHDAGMQRICLRGYLRLQDAGGFFQRAETAFTLNTEDTVSDQFDCFAALVLFAMCNEVKRLAAQVLVALANQHAQQEAGRSKFLPSSTLRSTMPLLLPEKTFCVLCMAGYDTVDSVRAEVARCLRRFSRVLMSEVVEHALIKTQIDEAVAGVLPDVVKIRTRLMMSSGVLLSLLEDINVDVAAEASRTIARLSEMATTPHAGAGQWSARALERAITAHFDVLPRARMASAAQLCLVLVNSLGRLLVCRHKVDTKTEFTISSADLSCLVSCAVSSADSSKAAVVGTLLVFQYCDLSSVWAVQRLVDFVLEIAASPSFEGVDDNDGDAADYWSDQLFVMIEALGNKCAKVLQADIALLDRLQREASTQRNGKRRLIERVCQALLCYTGLANADKSAVIDKPGPPSNRSSLFFLDHSTLKTMSLGLQKSCNDVSAGVFSAMKTLRMPPLDGNVAVYFKAIHRVRTALPTDDLDVSFQVTDTLLRLRQHVQLFPDALTTSAPTAHKYVSMQAMLNISPSVNSAQIKNSSTASQGQNQAQAFSHLHLSMDLQKRCQELVDTASSLYIKTIALSLLPRTELLQLILLGRIGVVLALLQDCVDNVQITESLRWVAQETTRLCFLYNDTQRQDDVWFPVQPLLEASSLDELKRVFVAIVRKAWPEKLIETAISRCTPLTSGAEVRYWHLAIAAASIQEPAERASTKPDPREVTANWPFEQRVRFALTNVRDVSQVYVKSVLPNGNVEYHHVPTHCILTQGPRKHCAEHTISLTVAPFSDPTEFVVAVCLGHPTLPGSVKQNASGSSEARTQMFVDISATVRVCIFHRTSYTSRQARSSTTP